MQERKKLYDPSADEAFQKPFIDRDEWLEREGYRCRYVHGGFEGTELRFAFFFPEADAYRGRFFHYLSPVQGDENAALSMHGMEDRIGFAVTHGAYYVESNMGVASFASMRDTTIIYRASAAAAEFSRKTAREMYGGGRPYGYVYGGSGGSYKTFACIENTAVWDGAVPYVTGTPVSIPNSFTMRARAKRVLRRVLPLIADHTEPGGIEKEELYSKMTDEEAAVLEEATRFGFPMRDWFMYSILDDGSLPIFVQMLRAADPEYYTDFWTKEGYFGADPNNSVNRDRIRFEARIVEMNIPGVEERKDACPTGADDAWKRGRVSLEGKAWLRLDRSFPSDAYVQGTYVTLISGESRGYSVVLKEGRGDIAVIEPFFGACDFAEKFANVKPGDGVLVDNSDYIALQSLHIHQTPKSGYPSWNVYRNADGTPKYPQRPLDFGLRFARGGCGSVQSGDFGNAKVIVVAALMDESALPWMADWYRRLVQEVRGDDAPHYRLWYVDRAFHGDQERTPDDLHLVSYLGVLHSALLSVSDWVERGIAPNETTVYSVEEGIVTAPDDARLRKGVQPTVSLLAGGEKCAVCRCGEEVEFAARIVLPERGGRLTAVEWSFDGRSDYPEKGTFLSDGETAEAYARHRFEQAGTYFVAVRCISQLRGEDDRFTRIFALDRVRVTVK